MISVVIATRDSQRVLGACLAALGPALIAGLLREVIFADGGSCDDTEAIAEATGARFVPAPRAEGPQLRAGVAAARGPWVLAMPAGTVLSPGWVEAVERHIRAVPARGAWLPQRATVLASWRGRLLGLPRHAPALLLPLSLYRAAGGFPPVSTGAIPALARRLGGGRLRMLPVTALPPPASTAT